MDVRQRSSTDNRNLVTPLFGSPESVSLVQVREYTQSFLEHVLADTIMLPAFGSIFCLAALFTCVL